MNSDGSHVSRLTHFGPKFKTVVGSENWSPDGRKIVFVELAAGNCGGGQLWIMDSDGTHRPHRLLNDQSFVDTEPSFSPNGKMVVFSRVPSSYNSNNAIRSRWNLGPSAKVLQTRSYRQQRFRRVYDIDGLCLSNDRRQVDKGWSNKVDLPDSKGPPERIGKTL